MAVVTMVAVASCGGDSGEEGRKVPPPALASSPNPCALLQAGEVEAVVGNAVIPEQVFSEGGASLAGAKVCQYKAAPQPPGAAGGANRVPTDVTVEVASAYPREVFVKYTTANKAARPVPGLGTDAVWSEALSRLVVLQGDAVVAVSLLAAPSDQGAQDKAARLASEALKRV
ncbi:MAG: hypothetical protein M3404_00180 [Actinomycetota bacterium]|nr:hypothetical protein [Actinomycetota bacterium]